MPRKGRFAASREEALLWFNRNTRQRFPRGWRRWIVATVALGLVCLVALTLALWRQASIATDCRQATPLPTGVRIVTPGTDVPQAVAPVCRGLGRCVETAGLLAISLLFRDLARGQSSSHRAKRSWSRRCGRTGTPGSFSAMTPPRAWMSRCPIFSVRRRALSMANSVFSYQCRCSRVLAYRVVGETLQGTLELGDTPPTDVALTRVTDLAHWACGADDAQARPPAVASARDRLTAEELLKEADAKSGLVHNAYFMPVGQSAPALHPLRGKLRVEALTILKTRHGCPGVPETLPPFTIAFFTHGEYLVPVVRDLLQPPGNLIVSPGQVWSEPADGGMSRASFPFIVVSPDSNETHNGVATFLYDGTRVSALRFQVVQETAAWAKYDGWGRAAMSYSPGPITDEEALRAQFAAELESRIPIQPWSALPIASGAHWPAHFDGEAAPEDVSASGLIVDGRFTCSCETRAGPTPTVRRCDTGCFPSPSPSGRLSLSCGSRRSTATTSSPPKSKSISP